MSLPRTWRQFLIHGALYLLVGLVLLPLTNGDSLDARDAPELLVWLLARILLAIGVILLVCGAVRFAQRSHEPSK